jgi:alanine-glyoxylate transaminase/serine-glyoxylate transaminase/serine-pyruvate transaminase
MKAYEGGSAAYFATPPVNLIHAYHESLSQITGANPSLDERLRLHNETSRRVKDAARELGLSQLPVDPEVAANGMTAVRPPPISQLFPELVDEPVFLVHSCGAQMASSPPSFYPLSYRGASLSQVV